MGRHPTDHRAPPQGGRLRHFLRIAQDSAAFWQSLRRRPVAVPATNRRTVEFIRIAKGREA